MFFKREATGVALEEMENCWIIAISTNAVVNAAWLRCSKTRCLSINSFEYVCMFGIGVDLP